MPGPAGQVARKALRLAFYKKRGEGAQCRLPADLDTPLSIYLKLVDGPCGYLLQSVHGGEKWGRHSIIGLPARRRYTVRASQWTETLDGVVIDQREVADPLAGMSASPPPSTAIL